MGSLLLFPLISLSKTKLKVKKKEKKRKQEKSSILWLTPPRNWIQQDDNEDNRSPQLEGEAWAENKVNEKDLYLTFSYFLRKTKKLRLRLFECKIFYN